MHSLSASSPAAAHSSQVAVEDSQVQWVVVKALTASFLTEVRATLMVRRQGKRGRTSDLRGLSNLSLTLLAALQFFGDANLVALENVELVASVVEESFQRSSSLNAKGQRSMLAAVRSAALAHYRKVGDEPNSGDLRQAVVSSEQCNKYRLRYEILHSFAKSLAASLSQAFGLVDSVPPGAQGFVLQNLEAVVDAALTMTASVGGRGAQPDGNDKASLWDAIAASLESYEAEHGNLAFKSVLQRSLAGARFIDAGGTMVEFFTNAH